MAKASLSFLLIAVFLPIGLVLSADKFKKTFALPNGKKIHLVVDELAGQSVDAFIIAIGAGGLQSVLQKALARTVVYPVDSRWLGQHNKTIDDVIDFLSRLQTRVQEVTFVIAKSDKNWQQLFKDFDYWLLVQVDDVECFTAQNQAAADLRAVISSAESASNWCSNTIASVVLGTCAYALWRYRDIIMAACKNFFQKRAAAIFSF